MKSAKPEIRLLLFDVGGVLVELSGVDAMLAWMEHRVSREELWRMWLTSPAVRAFETGRTTPEAFAGELIAEMALPVSRAGLLTEFGTWATGLFPGARELLQRVPRRYVRATLSNSNPLHWAHVMDTLQLRDCFDHHFASHLTGRIKPDAEAFLHVTEVLGCPPAEVLFLDDNRLNVEAAMDAGMNAALVRGTADAELALIDAGILG